MTVADEGVPMPDEAAVTPGPSDDDVRAAQTHALASEMLAEVMVEIDRADQKASLLISSLGIAFSIVLSGMLGGGWSPADLGSFGVILWTVGAIAASASVVAAALAVWPRLSKGPGPGAITYWGQIRGMPSPQAVAAALAERGLQPPERTYQQLLVLSAVAQRKYRNIRQSMVLAGIASGVVVLAFLLGF
ncbi:Pycsar system effector family protein [Microbacterium sp. SS28]|uniref:Pycsar system effector family protein n=1 Tax=Microbacterium sp. SS28 TaxID=2919948 RepID=UPI001FA954C7|nr:Pycsar system effector family protein [Microbacterium sp. SS28]